MILSDINEVENSFRWLAENLPGIVYRILIEDNNRMVFFNNMVQTMTGYSPEDLKPGEVCSIDPLILPEDKLNVIKIVKDAIENNVPFEVEYRIHNKSGELKWFNERGRPIRGDNRNPSYIDGVIFDVTERKEVEKKLKTSQESLERLSNELETILDHYPGLAFYKDTNNNFIRINQNVVDYYNSDTAGVKANLTKKDIEGKNLSDLIPKDIAQAYWDDDLEVIKSGTPKLNIEESFKTEHGTKWLNSHKIPYFDENGEIRGIIGFSIDITESKKAEQKLKESEKKLEESQDILEQLNEVFLKFKKDPIFNLQLLINTAGLLLKADCALFNVLKRVNRKEVLESLVTYNEPPNFTQESDPKGHICTDIIKDNPDDVVIIKNLDKTDYIKTDENVRKYDLKQYAGYVVRFNNKPTATFCVVYKENREMSENDILTLKILSKSASTELARWNSRIDLQKSEEKFRLAFKHATDAIIWANPKTGLIINCNDAAEILLEKSKEEIIGQHQTTIHPPEKAEYYANMFKSRIEQKGFVNDEAMVITKSGKMIPVHINASVTLIGGEPVIQGIFQNITEHKKIEFKLKESEEKYRNLTEQSLIGVAVIQDNVFKYVNQRYAEIGGYVVEEMINWQPEEFIKTIHPTDREKVMTQSIKKQRGDKNVIDQYTFQGISKTGEAIWIELYSKTIMYESRLAILITIIDITDRKKAEQKLIESEEKYRSLVENAQEGVWAVDENNDTIFANPKICEMLGYTKDEMMGKNLDLFLDDSMLELTNSFRKHREKGLKDTYDLELIKKDGILIYTSVKAAPILNENGEFKGSFAYITDITNRKKAEQKLKESEEKFRKQNIFLNNILESLTHPFYVINVKDYTVALTNLAASSEGLEIGQYCYSLTHNRNKPCEAPCKCPLDEVKKTKRACLVEHKHYDREGDEKIYEISGYPILDESGNVVQMIEYALNITDRKKAENNLRKIAQQWRTTFDAMSESVFLLDIEQNVVQCNKATLDILGKEKYDEIIGHSCCEIMHGIKEPVEWCPMIRMIESSHKESSIAQLGDKWCEISVDPVINDEGTLIGAVHIITDITERRKIDQKLKESEEKFRTIAERTFMGIVILQDAQIKYVNNALSKMFGYSYEEIYNWEMDDLVKLIHPEDLSSLREYSKNLRLDDFSLKQYISYRIFTKYGKLKWIDQFSKEILYKERPAELITIIDITEKKEVEQELIKLSNLKSEILRRTSHELKTPLVSIKGFSDLLLELHRDKLDDYVTMTIKQIRIGCSRLESLISDILKTAELDSGTVQLKNSKEDLSLLIKFCVAELKGLSDLRNHTLKLNILDSLIATFEKEQMHTVISNILSNAIKFTPSNGIIEVKLEKKKSFIIISIKDNGLGFTEEEKTQIFKQFGKIERYGQGHDVLSEGSGLGLYISKKIVELHGGEIWVESKGRNKGSTFKIRLPFRKETQ